MPAIAIFIMVFLTIASDKHGVVPPAVYMLSKSSLQSNNLNKSPKVWVWVWGLLSSIRLGATECDGLLKEEVGTKTRCLVNLAAERAEKLEACRESSKYAQ